MESAPKRFKADKSSSSEDRTPDFLHELASTPNAAPTAASKWTRPKYEASLTTPISFQWNDISLTDGPAYKAPSGSNNTSSVVPIIRLTGTTAEGWSIMTHIHGFKPYFYMTCPSAITTDLDASRVQAALEARLAGVSKSGTVIEAVQIVRNRQSIYGYHFDKTMSLLKVFVTLPAFVPKVRSLIENGGWHVPGLLPDRSYATFESNVPFILRFMIDTEITGCNWLTLPAGKFEFKKATVSRCTIEVDISYQEIVSHAPVGSEWGKLAPVRILSFDIECMGRKGFFPDASQDPVIQIANVVSLQGSEDKPFIRNVFTLGNCKPIVGAHVMSFDTEGEMLNAWAAFVREVDPDILTGYNIEGFDIPYLMDRGRALSLGPRYSSWGRLCNVSNVQEKKSFSSAQYGKTEGIRTIIHGRTTFDLLPIMRRSHQLSSYSLNSVSATFLGQQKEDVPHQIISTLQKGTDDDRHRLAVYCLKDALLPMRLVSKLAMLVNYTEMARVTGVPLEYLTERGQQIKVFCMILRHCRKVGMVVPHHQRNNNNNGGGDATYEGATVIEPKKAYYTVPIATLDFASLYPSIMQAFNLCFSTLVAPDDVANLDPSTYATSPSGDVFVTNTTKKGILPQILEELLQARKQAKRDMKAATDPMEKAVQNGRQLALKVSANSVYGFTGANVGQLPCIPIASSTTSYGRQLLERTKEEVERLYTIANGYKGDADVVYGDTDSVMVRFGGIESVAEAMPLAMEAAEKVSSIFPNPIKLEFEKVYFPYLLMNKKRYAGLYWTNPDKFDKLDTKGLETVRRDNCLLVRRVVSKCLQKILIDRNVKDALEYTKGIISDVLQNKTDLSLLVITKGLKKTGEESDYKVRTAHVELAKRMRIRDPGNAPVLGDRVAYVVVDKGKKQPMYTKAEDPVYALENNIPLDCDYYLNNQLKNPLERIFEPIIGDGRVKSELFAGPHTLKRSKPKLKASSGGMMKFAVKKMKCLGCKAPLSGKAPLCESCGTVNGREGEIYMKHLDTMNEMSKLFSRLWTQCQNCQGSLHQEVLCTSRDCPIFYKRIKVQKDLSEAQGTLERFAW